MIHLDIPGDFFEQLRKGGPGSGHFGHDGRPGIHGGSLPNAGSRPPTKVPDHVRAALRTHAEMSLALSFKERSTNLDEVRDAFDHGGYKAHGVASDLRYEFSQTMVQQGLATEYEMLRWRDMQGSWTGSSDTANSDAIEYVVADETGGSVYSAGEDRTNDKEFRKRVFSQAALSEDRIRFLVAHEHEFQQGVLRKLYGDEMTIYRGVLNAPDSETGSLYVRTNGISSFSRNLKIADDFGREVGGKSYKLTVPTSRVFSSGMGGFGTMYESEVVLKGGVYKAQDLAFAKQELQPGLFDIDARRANRRWLRSRKR